MPVPRVQFTVRRMMVAVAVAAILSGCFVSRQRWKRASTLASIHANYAGKLEVKSQSVMKIAKARENPAWAGIVRSRSESVAARARYHRTLAEKYRLAARYPFLPVAPDPPEPE